VIVVRPDGPLTAVLWSSRVEISLRESALLSLSRWRRHTASDPCTYACISLTCSQQTGCNINLGMMMGSLSSCKNTNKREESLFCSHEALPVSIHCNCMHLCMHSYILHTSTTTVPSSKDNQQLSIHLLLTRLRSFLYN
jgi:hypothetical protein